MFRQCSWNFKCPRIHRCFFVFAKKLYIKFLAAAFQRYLQGSISLSILLLRSIVSFNLVGCYRHLRVRYRKKSVAATLFLSSPLLSLSLSETDHLISRHVTLSYVLSLSLFTLIYSTLSHTSRHLETKKSPRIRTRRAKIKRRTLALVRTRRLSVLVLPVVVKGSKAFTAVVFHRAAM